jgi:hypothetical protein
MTSDEMIEQLQGLSPIVTGAMNEWVACSFEGGGVDA